MKTFHLDRIEDKTGVSGTGIVAQGVEFDDGTTAMRWRSAHPTTVIGNSLAEIERIHGHNGATRFVIDPPVAELREALNGAYAERNQCVLMLAKLAMEVGWRCGIGYDDSRPGDPDMEGFRRVVFIEAPTGQLSWHITDREYFDSFRAVLPVYWGSWDGHSTETKYRRMWEYEPSLRDEE